MHLMLRLPHLAGVLLLAATPFAGAASPLPDPIAPAVIGRPLDQIRPARPVSEKAAAAKPKRPKQVAAAPKATDARPSATVAGVPAAVKQAPALRPAAKPAPEPPVDPGTQVVGNVGRNTTLAGMAPGPGAYFSSKHQALVRRYYEAHPVSGGVAKWKIGEAVPARAALTGVPDDLRAALPVLPRGYQYVQLDGEVVLVAVQSRTVVDGVSRSLR